MRTFKDIAGELAADGLDVIQVNVGLQCNLSCSHCHLKAGPERREVMDRATMEKVEAVSKAVVPTLVDITGGSPELNPDLPWLLARLRHAGLKVQARSNLAILDEPGFEKFISIYRDLDIDLVASLPCYSENNVDAVRGAGVFQKALSAMRRLNASGYARPGGPRLDLVFNHPLGPYLPPCQQELEGAYRQQLAEYGVGFSSLITITNMPVGRYGEQLEAQGQAKGYWELLRQQFNPATLDGLMCRRQVNIGWNGVLYDCDFNQAMGLRINHGAPNHIDMFDVARLSHRMIVTGEHCLGCTAGAGSSCSGSLL